MVTDITVDQGCWSTVGSLVSRRLSIKTEGKKLESQGREKGTWPERCTTKEGGKGINLGNLFLIFCLFWIP